MVNEKILRVGVERKQGYLYCIDKKGNVAQVAMSWAKNVVKGMTVVAKTQITKEAGYLYFLDKDGDISRAKLMHGRVRHKK